MVLDETNEAGPEVADHAVALRRLAEVERGVVQPISSNELFQRARLRAGLGSHGRLPSVTRDELLSRISIDPNICFGKPCIRGHRIWVSLVLDFLASGMSVKEIMDEYRLEEADVLACIAYGAEMSRFTDVPIQQNA